MAPKDSSLQQYAAYMSGLSPELFSSSNEAYARLQELKTNLSDRGANLKAQCVQDSTHSCELPRQLQQWNRVLEIIGVQLRERNNCGELAVVCFQKIYRMHTECRFKRSVLLFHWLLINHRCVTMLRMEEWGVFDSLFYITIFYDAMDKCTGLRNLQLCFASACEKLLNAMQCMPNLEEVDCIVFDTSNEYNNMTTLAHVIRTKGKLNRLVIDLFSGVGHTPYHLPGMGSFVAAIRSNTAIRDLSIDVSWMTEEDCRLFLQVIKERPSLMTLRLCCWYISPTLRVADVAAAVKDSKALVRLELTRFFIDTRDAWALARSLTCSQKLQQLELVSCRHVVTEPNSVASTGLEMEGDSASRVPLAMQPFVHMLRNVKSLRRLRFPLYVSTTENERVGFDALANEASVESVRWKCKINSYLIDSCSAVSEAGTGVQVTIEDLYRDDQPLEGITEWAHVVRFRLQDWEQELTVGHFKQLHAFHKLSTLTVGLITLIKPDQAEILAQFLRLTKSLSKITMSLEAKRTESMVLLDGLSRNTSITTLIIERWCTSRRAGRFLADVVCSSKKLRSLTYDDSSVSTSRAFCSRLAKSIRNNITLLLMVTRVLTAPKRQLALIHDVIARNNQLLVHAARFVSGRDFGKIGAEALELNGSDPMLVEKVQEMSAVNEKEAEDMIRKRLRDLDYMDVFMRASGVVRDSVVCELSPDGSPGLDALPWLCWQHIRQYLRLVDVVTQPWNRNAVLWQDQR
ncbi:uncharacterized protein LOC144130498 [Amblyomma americanum]